MASQHTFDPFPGFDRLYLLGDTGSGRAFRAEVGVSVERAIALIRGSDCDSGTVSARWVMGAQSPSDVVWTNMAAPLLVGNRVVELLSKIGARGWSTYEVDLVGKSGELVTGFHGLSVRGRCGAIDNCRSVEVPRIFPGGVFPVWKGLYFDPETWDGSQVFMPEGKTGWIFVAEEVKLAFEKAKVKNVVFRALCDVERSKVEMSVGSSS